MILALSPAASWGLILLLVCAVVSAVLAWHERCKRRHRAARIPIANRYAEIRR